MCFSPCSSWSFSPRWSWSCPDGHSGWEHGAGMAEARLWTSKGIDYSRLADSDIRVFARNLANIESALFRSGDSPSKLRRTATSLSLIANDSRMTELMHSHGRLPIPSRSLGRVGLGSSRCCVYHGASSSSSWLPDPFRPSSPWLCLFGTPGTANVVARVMLPYFKNWTKMWLVAYVRCIVADRGSDYPDWDGGRGKGRGRTHTHTQETRTKLFRRYNENTNVPIMRTMSQTNDALEMFWSRLLYRRICHQTTRK